MACWVLPLMSRVLEILPIDIVTVRNLKIRRIISVSYSSYFVDIPICCCSAIRYS